MRRTLKTLTESGEEVEVVNGGAKGADRMSSVVAGWYGLKVREYPADWGRYGRGAGPIRNQEMLDKEPIGLVIAFFNEREKSRGTEDMVRRARAKGITVTEIEE